MTLHPINPTIRRWLDHGQATEALLGRNDFFISDHDYYEEHDRILVANQLVTWAFPDHVDAAAGAVNAAVEQLIADNDSEGTVDLIGSIVLVSEDRGRSLPVDRHLLDGALDRAGMADLLRTSKEHVYLVTQRLEALAPATVASPGDVTPGDPG